MIKSMTGYGKAEAVCEGRKITVEVRSLNSKQMDISLKLPSIYRPLDNELRTMVSRTLNRGKVDFYVNYENLDGNCNINIDEKLFTAYYNQLRTIGQNNGIGWGCDEINAQLIPAILRLPDVVSGDREAATDEEIAVLTRTAAEALAALDEFRTSEGAILIGDLLTRVDRIMALLEDVVPYEERRIEGIKTRIIENLESTGVTVDRNRFEQELVYYVEKLDITEEKVRLSNHCKYFHEVAGGDEFPGRKLGFIAQEMGREINTLGSKANDADIQKIVVCMKDELEKIKEQLLNIL